MKKTIFYFSIIAFVFIFNNKTKAQGLTTYNNANSYAGYTLFPLNEKTYLIDNCGNIVNEWTFANEARYCSYLMPNGNIFNMGKIDQSTFTLGGGYSGNFEIRDKDDNLVWNYLYYSPDEYSTHHDAEVLPNGNFLVIVWEQLSNLEAIAIGRNPAYLWDNVLWALKIVELQPVGTNQINTVWEWHMKDHVIQDYNANAPNFGVVANNPQLYNVNIGGGGKDWLHANGIDYNKYLDQITVSLRDLDEIIVIDHSTTTAEAATHSGGIYGKGGDILYRWGNPQNYNRGNEADKILDNMHDIRWVRKDFLYDGAMSVFNNEGISNSQSSVEIFYPPMDSAGFYTQPINNSTPYGPTSSHLTYTNGPSGSFYSIFQGGMQVLPNGNVLITEAWSQNIFELEHLTGNVVWSYLNPISNNVRIFKAVRYMESDVELSTYNLIPTSTTAENPSSNVTLNCGSISYDAFCLANYTNADLLIGNINDTKDYETDGVIESNQKLQNGAIVDYDSNTEIILLPGFEIEANADFYGFIDGCNNGIGGLN